MQQTRATEVGTGLFSLLGIGALFFLVTQTTTGNDFAENEAYEITARFQNVGSLKPRAPVSMAGVTIGRVTEIRFDPVMLDAVVTMVIENQYDQIPDDTDASILTAGLLGSQYVGLQPGGSDIYLAEGDEVLFTQSAVVLENLIGKFLVNRDTDDTE